MKQPKIVITNKESYSNPTASINKITYKNLNDAPADTVLTVNESEDGFDARQYLIDKYWESEMGLLDDVDPWYVRLWNWIKTNIFRR